MTLRTNRILRSMLLLTALSMLFGVETVRAQQQVWVWFEPQGAQVGVGSTTTVQLMVKAPVAVGGFDLTLDYNPNLLLLENWTYGDFLSELYVVKKEDSPGHFRLVSVQLDVPPVAGEGKLMAITFRGLSVGTSQLTLSEVTFANATGNQYVVEATNGSISVGAANTSTFTPTATATMTLQPGQSATNTPSTPYPMPATATRTRTPLPTQPGVTFPTATQRANLTSTAQARLTATIQATAETAATDLQEPIAPILTPSHYPVSGTQTPTDSGMTTDPFVIPIRPESTLNFQQVEDKFASASNLIRGFILFDVAALILVIFLVWKRRRKDNEGNS